MQKYQILSPSGNDTALVIVNDIPNITTRRNIEKIIMQKHSNVEQVGFITNDMQNATLEMAGGELCGNAARCAAKYYLNQTVDTIYLYLPNLKLSVNVGINNRGEAFTTLPIYSLPKKINTVMHLVEMKGISHLVVNKRISAYYLNKTNTREALLKEVKTLINPNMTQNNAHGVILTEDIFGQLFIHPCIFVNGASKDFYETGCGSGSIAVALVYAVHANAPININIMQPSGKFINTTIEMENEKIVNATISGEVEILGEYSL